MKSKIERLKIGNGYYQAGYGKGFKKNPVVYLINGFLYAFDTKNWRVDGVKLREELEGYVRINSIDKDKHTFCQCSDFEHVKYVPPTGKKPNLISKNEQKANPFKKGDTVKWTEKAQTFMPLHAHNNEVIVIDVNGQNILIDGDKTYSNHEWFETVKTVVKNTKGKWELTKDNSIRSGQALIAQICSANNNDIEKEANGNLLVDAGNTTNQCGLLPSELLKQRNEMLEALNFVFQNEDFQQSFKQSLPWLKIKRAIELSKK